MEPKRRAVVFKVKNVRYSPEVPENADVYLAKVESLVFRVLEETRAASSKPRTVLEYLTDAIVRLGVEVVLMKASLEGVKEDRDREI